jgi:hypothetical protein
VVELAKYLIREIEKVRLNMNIQLQGVDRITELLTLDKPFDEETLRKNPRLDRVTINSLMREQTVTADTMLPALQKELNDLMVDARKKYQTIEKNKGRVILLLDDADLYVKALGELRDKLTPDGLGDTSEPIPVVMSFSNTELTADTLSALFTNRRKGWLKSQTLAEFSTVNDEDLLACKWLLLNPSGEKEKGRILNEETKTLRNLLYEAFYGVPGRFADPLRFNNFISRNTHIICEAKDEDYLQGMKDTYPQWWEV